MKKFSWAGYLTVVIYLMVGTEVWGQTQKHSINKKDLQFVNWHNLDFKKNKTLGISTDKAYAELLKNKKPQRVIVAVIDGGIDINHEDLNNKIWTNIHEIPGNGIDDDHNGFIDDIHGWNFLGNSAGENIDKENLELTRVYKKLRSEFTSEDSAKYLTDTCAVAKYDAIKSVYNRKFTKAREKYDYIEKLASSYMQADSIFQVLIGKKDYSAKELRKFKTGSDYNLQQQKELLQRLNRLGITRSDIIDYFDYLNNQIKYHFNLQFSPRTIIGDDINVFPGLPYGNNDVTGPDPKHGSFVAGIIGAERNNNLGIKGIADSVKIMVLRAVPDGDEYDKDIANAIYYAVNNGAQIINCSFGKSYSPQKQFVDEAIEYANEHGVLIVHAAGNDAQNIDVDKVYPTPRNYSNELLVNNYLVVGASSLKANKTMVASFSNYGKKSVDIFAPGYRIYSTSPGNNYEVMDGTSFAAPMVTGAAALIKSVYPQLTMFQIKDILLKSGQNYEPAQVYLPVDEDSNNPSKKTVSFGELSNTGVILNVYNALKLAATIQAN